MIKTPISSEPEGAADSWRSAIRIALIYAAFGFAWIIFSDSILSWFVRDTHRMTSLQTYKGWFYVAVTAWLIFILVRVRLQRIEELNRSLLGQQAFFRSLIDHSPQAMVVVDGEGSFQHVNERFTEIFGYTQDDCPNLEAWWPLAYPDPQARAGIHEDWDRLFSESLETGIPAPPYEAKVTCKTGVVRDIRFHFRQVGGVAVVSFEDMTDIKQMWSERLDLEAKLAQSNRLESLGVMAGGIAHDFNNILTAIVGHSEMVREDLSTEGPARESIGKVLGAADRARDLVRQILAFSRRDKQEFKSLDIASTVNEAMSLVVATLPSSVAVNLEVDPQAGFVLADRTQVNQILFNLCTNAYHSFSDGDGKILVRISTCELGDQRPGGLADLARGPYVRLDVVDNGVGMDEETRNRIFEPFFTTKETGQGIGMGLSVVHGVIGSHGGAIEVESVPGQGTTVSVYFPRQEEGLEQTDAPRIQVAESGRERILFVDDEQILADLGKATLESLGYRVVSVTSAPRALDLFRDDPHGFDLLVTDQTMPQMSGVDLVREFKGLKPDMPIVICTGFSEALDESTALEVGAAGFLQKPFGRETLAAAVRKALDQKP